MRAFRVLIALVLAGCSTISDEPPPADFPNLAISAEFLSTQEMRDRCQRYAQAGELVEACSEINLREKTCVTFFDRDLFGWRQIDHEVNGHCRGKDHPGSTYLRELWGKWKRAIQGSNVVH